MKIIEKILIKGRRMFNQDQIKQIPDTAAGVMLAAGGVGGTVAQSLTEYANTFVLCGNVFLVAGGAYLMVHKLIDRRRNRRKDDYS